MKARIILVLLTCLLTVSNSAGQSIKPQEIDKLVSPFVDRNYFSGIVLVESGGKVVYEKAFGMANVELGVPLRTESRVGIASITKPMTDIILARLVEEKKIAPTDTVSKFIPDFPNGDKITVSMLASHRAGIPHRVMPPEQEAVPHSSSDMAEWIAKAKLDFEPGSKRSYSSAGYALLARLLELASGKSYSQLLEEFVFAPAGMKDSVDFQGEPIMKNRAQDYLLRPQGPVNAALKDYSFLIGGGSVFGTAGDLYKFSRAVLDGRYGESVKKELVSDGEFSASGRTNGHRAYVEFYDGKGSGFVVLSNISSGAFDRIASGLSDLLKGKTPSAAFVFPTLAEPGKRDLSEYAGDYPREDGGTFNIIAKDDALYSGDIAVYPTTKKDCFFDFSFFGDVCFGRGPDGKVNSIVWKGEGFELKGKKQ